ncbi:MAG: tyramine oxidase, partial [Elainella sp.]
MTSSPAISSPPALDAALPHPLEPLSAAEVERAVELVRQQGAGPTYRFPCVTLHEPPKQEVLRYQTGDPIDRQA